MPCKAVGVGGGEIVLVQYFEQVSKRVHLPNSQGQLDLLAALNITWGLSVSFIVHPFTSPSSSTHSSESAAEAQKQEHQQRDQIIFSINDDELT